jgi:DNA-binding NarL/FixJ family response regulator
MRQEPVTVYIADDHQLVIDGAIRRISEIECLNVTVVGSTRDSREVLREVSEIRPDIVLMDVGFPKNPSGLSVTKDIVNSDLDARVIISSRYDNYPYFWKAISFGAKGYVPKGSDEETFKEAIISVARGKKYLPECLIESEQYDERMEELSPQEFEWARYFGQGFDPQKIADRLNVSRNATYKYKQRVKNKLFVDDDNKLREILGYYFDVPEWTAA